MTLELKHICAYLPYNLELVNGKYKGIITALMPNGEFKITCSNWHENIAENKYKPLLIPLTPIQSFVVLTTEECLLISKGLAHNIPQWKFEILIENHFDVFGLIEAGLAINKNEIM